MSQPYVLLSQGRVEAASEAIVLDLDILLTEPAVTKPEPVEMLRKYLAKLVEDGQPVGQWVTVCDGWLLDHLEANQPVSPS